MPDTTTPALTPDEIALRCKWRDLRNAESEAFEAMYATTEGKRMTELSEQLDALQDQVETRQIYTCMECHVPLFEGDQFITIDSEGFACLPYADREGPCYGGMYGEEPDGG